MDIYQQFIHISRYSRWLPKLKRRESWPETVQRYVDFFVAERGEEFRDVLENVIGGAIERLEVMPSMRALMTAGEALRRENVAGYNCCYVAVNSKRSFSEAFYILLCFHPDTEVVTKRGDTKIKDVVAGDFVRSFDEVTKVFKWCLVTSQVKTPSKDRPKVLVELDNGQSIRCTADHRWLTSNRGWVEAQHLTVEDDLVAPTQSIYKITNKASGKSYVGMTNTTVQARFTQHTRTSSTADTNSHLHKAIRKYGVDAFMVELIDVAYTREEASSKERFWIDALGTYGANGYNSTRGGEGVDGFKWTDEQRHLASVNAYERTPEHREILRLRFRKNQEKITAHLKTLGYREAQRVSNTGENNPRFGKHHTDEHKLMLSKINTGELNRFFGKSHTDECKKKISDKKVGTGVGEKNPYFGKRHSTEVRAKMSAYWAAKREQKQSKLEVA